MSFFNRVSAPSGLSTPTPGGSSIFGTPASNQPAGAGTGGGLFGGGAATSAPATGGLFGNSTATNNTATSGGLFGTPAASTTAAGGTGTGGLFGNNAGATTTQAGTGTGGGGLFGAGTSTAQTSAPATGGLFGTATAPTGGLFGNTATNNNKTSTPSGGLFGMSSTTPAAGAGSLFGGAGATGQAQKPTLGLFGAAGNATQNTTNNSAPSLLGQTSLYNNTSQQQQQQQAQAVKVDWSNLTPYHKFNELSDNVKQEVEAAEKYILAEIQKSEGLAAAFPEHREMIQSVSGDAELMERRLLTTNSFLQSDASALDNLVKYQKLDDQHASLSVRTLDLLRLPHAARMLQSNLNNQSQHQQLLMQQQQQHQQQQQPFSQPLSQSQYPNTQNNMPLGGNSAYAPIPTVSSTTTNEIDITSNVGMMNYFNRHGGEMETKLKNFLDSVSEVELSLKSVEALAQASAGGQIGSIDATGGVGGRQDSRRLNQTLRGFNDALNDVSVRVVEAKEGLREIQQMKGGRRLF